MYLSNHQNHPQYRAQRQSQTTLNAVDSSQARLSKVKSTSLSPSLKVSALAVAMLMAAPALNAANLRIIGGSEAQIEQFPYISALVNRGSDATSAFCGATVIHPRWVLTAAHCLENTAASSIDVLTGVDNLQRASEGERIAVSRIINHPAYDANNIRSDIALLELERPTQAPIVSVATSSNAALFATGQPVAVAGWGDRTNGNGDFPSQLHAVDLSISNFNSCSQAYGGLTSVHLCASVPDGTRDSCSGDSGGPLVARTEEGVFQVGIVSFGDGCASATHPGVYTRVSEFSDFITQHVGSSALASNAVDELPSNQEPTVISENTENTENTESTESTESTENIENTPSDSFVDNGPNSINDTAIELTQLHEHAYEIDSNTVSVLVEVYNASDSDLVLTTPIVSSDVAVSIDSDACTTSPLSSDDFCDLELIWDKSEGNLDADLSVTAFTGAQNVQSNVNIQADVLQSAEFSQALDHEADYFTDNLDVWDEFEPEAAQGSTALTAELTEDEDGYLAAEFDSNEGDYLDFLYQLEHTDCVISINGEERYFLNASDEWQQASIELPANARVSWRFEPAADYPLRNKENIDSRIVVTKASLDSFKLRRSGEALQAASTLGNTPIDSPLINNMSGGSLGTGILLLLLSAAGRFWRSLTLSTKANLPAKANNKTERENQRYV